MINNHEKRLYLEKRELTNLFDNLNSNDSSKKVKNRDEFGFWDKP